MQAAAAALLCNKVAGKSGPKDDALGRRKICTQSPKEMLLDIIAAIPIHLPAMHQSNYSLSSPPGVQGRLLQGRDAKRPVMEAVGTWRLGGELRLPPVHNERALIMIDRARQMLGRTERSRNTLP